MRIICRLDLTHFKTFPLYYNTEYLSLVTEQINNITFVVVCNQHMLYMIYVHIQIIYHILSYIIRIHTHNSVQRPGETTVIFDTSARSGVIKCPVNYSKNRCI